MYFIHKLIHHLILINSCLFHFNMIYYIYLRPFITFYDHLLHLLFHHLLQLAIFEYLLPFILFTTNGVFIYYHLLQFIPFIMGATCK